MDSIRIMRGVYKDQIRPKWGSFRDYIYIYLEIM